MRSQSAQHRHLKPPQPLQQRPRPRLRLPTQHTMSREHSDVSVRTKSGIRNHQRRQNLVRMAPTDHESRHHEVHPHVARTHLVTQPRVAPTPPVDHHRPINSDRFPATDKITLASASDPKSSSTTSPRQCETRTPGSDIRIQDPILLHNLMPRSMRLSLTSNPR